MGAREGILIQEIGGMAILPVPFGQITDNRKGTDRFYGVDGRAFLFSKIGYLDVIKTGKKFSDVTVSTTLLVALGAFFQRRHLCRSQDAGNFFYLLLSLHRKS
jgi:hypothetical protein